VKIGEEIFWDGSCGEFSVKRTGKDIYLIFHKKVEIGTATNLTDAKALAKTFDAKEHSRWGKKWKKWKM
jgi:hypothetical protein